jgi:2-isopropylmalate synthase
VCNAIDRAIHIPAKLVDFNVQSVTEGLDSLGQVSVRVQREGRIYMGRSTSTDIVVASAKAYVSALNRLLAQEGGREVPEPLTTP